MTPAVMTLQEISNDEIDCDRLLGVIDDHRSIWTAIRERDADTLMIVLRRHMEDGRRLIAQVLERNLTERSLTTSNTKESIRR